MPRSGQDVRILRRARVLALLSAFVLVVGGLVFLAPTATADGPTTFSNTASIAVPGIGDVPPRQGQASPYPSTIDVPAMDGLVTSVTVTLNRVIRFTASLSDGSTIST